MTRGVVFDLDGLLVDSEPIWDRVLRAVVARHGCAYDDGVRRRHLGMRLPDVARVLREAYGFEADPERIVDDLLAAFDAGLPAMPGAADALALAAADGRRVGLASSSPRRVVAHVLARFRWRFHAVCTGDDVTDGKPAPDIYLLAAARLGLPPARCVALEDSPHGVRAANAAGLACIAVPGTLASLLDLRPHHLA